MASLGVRGLLSNGGNGRMSALDATFLAPSEFTGSTDQYVLLAFDTSGRPTPPTVDDVRAEIADRVRSIAVLHRAVMAAPARLDHPIWVHAPADVHQRVVTAAEASLDWESCIETTSALFVRPLDPHVATWTVHVMPDVRGVPRSRGSSMVIVLQICHALVDGRGATAVMRALFGPSDAREANAVPTVTASRRVPGRIEMVVRSGIRAALRGVGSGPAVVESALAERRSSRLRAGGVLPHAPVLRPRGRFNDHPDDRRIVSVTAIPVSELRLAGLTVTHAALTAVSIAMERFARDHADPSAGELCAQVTVGVPDGSAWGANNRFVPAVVDLASGTPDVHARVAAIKSSLADEVARLTSPDALRQFAMVDRFPVPVLRRLRSRSNGVGDATYAHTSFTSLHRGPADLELLGSPAFLTAGFPALSQVCSISHGVYTLGDTVTVSVTLSPGAIDSAAEYPAYLRRALDEVAAAGSGV